MPYITVTAADGCLVNGKTTVIHYSVGTTLRLILSYAEEDGRTVKEWVIYDLDGVEIARFQPTEIYALNNPGSYFVSPAFN